MESWATTAAVPAHVNQCEQEAHNTAREQREEIYLFIVFCLSFIFFLFFFPLNILHLKIIR